MSIARTAGLGLLASIFVFGAFGVASADADTNRYGGIHPINAEDGMCYIEAPHIHAYAPYQVTVLFRKENNRYHFVGDPVAYGYDGPQFSYHGHHPIEIGEAEEYCYIDGAHFHHTAPTVTASFEVKGGIYWYVGELGPAYRKHLHKKKRINKLYADFHYDRPVVHVDPPAAYAGVVISVPAPTLSFEINATIGHARLEAGRHKHGKWHGKRGKYKHKHKKYRHKRSKRSKSKRRWKF